MVFLKYVVIGIAHPWEGTENRNDDKDISDYATGDNGRMLNGSVSDNVDDFVYKPTKILISLFTKWGKGLLLLTQNQRERTRSVYLQHAVESTLQHTSCVAGPTY